jgi:hypothetical protein
MASIKLFPEEVSLAPMATAVLKGIGRDGPFVVARYDLEPDDEHVFQARIGSHPELMEKRYEPLPGIWSRMNELDGSFRVDVGVREPYGRAWVGAIRQHKRSCESMVPSYQIKAQVLGFLADSGV